MLHTVYHTLFQPAVFKTETAFQPAWWQGGLLVLCVSTLATLTSAQGWSTQQLMVGLPLAWGQALLAWWFFSLLFHFASDIFGGQGRIGRVMAAVGFAIAPWIFTPLLRVFAQQGGATGQILAVLGALVLGFWSLALLAHLLALSESLSLDRALGALVMTLFLVGVLLTVSLVLSGLQIAFWGAALL